MEWTVNIQNLERTVWRQAVDWTVCRCSLKRITRRQGLERKVYRYGLKGQCAGRLWKRQRGGET